MKQAMERAAATSVAPPGCLVRLVATGIAFAALFPASWGVFSFFVVWNPLSLLAALGGFTVSYILANVAKGKWPSRPQRWALAAGMLVSVAVAANAIATIDRPYANMRRAHLGSYLRNLADEQRSYHGEHLRFADDLSLFRVRPNPDFEIHVLQADSTTFEVSARMIAVSRPTTCVLLMRAGVAADSLRCEER